VAAETAVALPVLVAVCLGLVWMVALSVAHLRVVDGAREGARALARGDAPASAVAAARRVAPAGAEVTLSRGAGQVRVRVAVRVGGPGGLWQAVPGVEVVSTAVAAEEP
jgi:Flp pilus assembly protein TadG